MKMTHNLEETLDVDEIEVKAGSGKDKTNDDRRNILQDDYI